MVLPVPRVTVEQVALATPVSLRAVRGYLKRLCSERILRHTAGVYGPGPRIRRWLKSEPKTLPGGNFRAYLIAKAERDAIARQESALLRAVQLANRRGA